MEKLTFTPKETAPPESEKLVDGEKESTESFILGKTRDGKVVCERDDNSHLHKEGGLTPELLGSALGVVDTNDKFFVEKQVDFDGIVGEKTCVETGPDDEIVMVYRKNRHGQSRMVKNRKAEPSNMITIFLKKDKGEDSEADYTLVSGYIGSKSEREPWDSSLREEGDREKSKEFWKNHALIYNDEEIDWDRTNAFSAMTKERQELELMSDKVFYEGLFVDPQTLYQKAPPKLARKIFTPHVTTKFNPKGDELNLEQLGTEAKITAIGYGNDGKNEGLLVRVEADDPVIQKACDALQTPHITLSLSNGAKAEDTAKLDFTPLKEEFEIDGKYGLYSQGDVIQSSSGVEALKS